MAGIGFELKKMFSKRGLLSIIKAYGYAGIVCTGPMLLGIALLLGIRVLAEIAGGTEAEIELLNCLIQYTLLVSILLSNALSMVSIRYTADQMYMERQERVLPSFWGSVSLMLMLGEPLYGVFLYASEIPFHYIFLCLLFFGELILVWTEISYLTAIKDYTGIMVAFVVSLVVALVTGYGLSLVRADIIEAMLIAVCVGYGMMTVWYYVLLAGYFPKGRCSAMHFLKWMDKYPQLVFIGLFLTAGMFGHIVIAWTGPLKEQVYGLLYVAPEYDIPALLAFLSTLITTINFVTSVEVNFYSKYRNYFSLFNEGGSYMDIEQAEREMKTTLVQELTYTFTKQFFATIVFIIAGTLLLPHLPLGMTEDMLGIYRVLCVGYAFYAVGNCAMLIQLYFADNKGALISVSVFMVISCVGTWLLRDGSLKYYGVGFFAGSVAFAIVALVLLYSYLRRLIFHVLCNQPLVVKEYRGMMTRLAEYFNRRYEKKYHIRYIEDNEVE